MSRFRLTSPRKPPLRENDVERACKSFLALRGYRLHRLHCGRARFPDGSYVELEPAGTPDWLCVHGRYPAFYLETKRPGELLASVQILKHMELTRGFRLHVVVADSVDVLSAWLELHEQMARERCK